MDPITLITASLIAGTTEVAKNVVPDIYAGLKDLIKHKIKKLVDDLEDPEKNEDEIKKQLVEGGADKDEQIIELAQKLLEQLKPYKISGPVEFDVIVRDKSGKVVDVLEDSRKRVMRVPEIGTREEEGVILKTPRVYPGATCHVKLQVGSIDVFDTKQLHVPLPKIYVGSLLSWFSFECDVWYKIQVGAYGNCTWEVHVGPPGTEEPKAKFSGKTQLVPAKL